jgi:hypothetical protein
LGLNLLHHKLLLFQLLHLYLHNQLQLNLLHLQINEDSFEDLKMRLAFEKNQMLLLLQLMDNLLQRNLPHLLSLLQCNKQHLLLLIL